MNLHGVVRATEAVDLFVRSDAENVAGVRRALRNLFVDDGRLMPVQRYRRVEDVPAPAALDPSDPVAMERVWGFLRRATDGLPPAFALGVRRYVSIEAADADRRAADVARMRRLRDLDAHG